MSPAPDPRSTVRRQLLPPAAPTVQAAHAWRRDVAATRQPRSRLSDAVALVLCVALLSLFVWTLPHGDTASTRIASTHAVPR